MPGQAYYDASRKGLCFIQDTSGEYYYGEPGEKDHYELAARHGVQFGIYQGFVENDGFHKEHGKAMYQKNFESGARCVFGERGEEWVHNRFNDVRDVVPGMRRLP